MPKPQSSQNQRNLDPLDKIIRNLAGVSPEDVSLIKRAFVFAERVHHGHIRHSGEPYLVHLLETAQILSELGAGSATIAAGLLHDTIDDAGIKKEDITKEFGKEIAFLVEGVTKLGHLKYKGVDRHNESLRKLFVAMSEDIRVLLIKLADRLHNMRTLSHVPKDKQKRIAAETLEIYAPVAYRLGIRKINRELEDLSFPYIYPKEYEEMKKFLKEHNLDRAESLEKFARSVRKELAKEGLVKINTEYRMKGLYSLYKKYLRHDKDLEKIHDISAMRILVDSIADCYQVLGIIHGRWRPLPNRIKDYIAFPKPNGYQALHTTIFTGDGNIVEVQIKTHEMQRYSEYGVASHLSYKAGGRDKNALAWVRALSSGDKSVSDFFSHRIFVFSPKGDVVDLPVDSTPIDFAYSIHSDVGNHMTGAKVNGKLVALDSNLHNGDIVFIMTKEPAKPNQKWIEMAKTSMAKRHIRNRLAKLRKLKK